MSFNVDDRVQINRTTDSSLDGQLGTILGIGIDSGYKNGNLYIVLLDKPKENKTKAILMTDSCLDLI